MEEHDIFREAREAFAAQDGVSEFCKVRCVALYARQQDVGVNWPRGPGFSLFLSSGLAGSDVAALAAVSKYLDGAPA
jgi:hypothetical protein